VTSIGSHTLIMAYAHIAHDCHVGDWVIMANAATLAGHVTVGDFAVIGALSAVHQFARVGKYAYIGGGSIVTQDVLPFSKTSAVRDVHAYGANSLGLQRRGFSPERVRQIQRAFRVLLASKLNTSQAIERLRSDGDLGEDVEGLIQFIRESERGVLK
jgi:UDP-N-acetylglucosamine acyltransferase